jgi:hypothetical protein
MLLAVNNLILKMEVTCSSENFCVCIAKLQGDTTQRQQSEKLQLWKPQDEELVLVLGWTAVSYLSVHLQG